MKDRVLLVATTNAGKVREIRAVLQSLPLKIVGLPEVLPGVIYRERGRTFLENARGKGRVYSRRTGLLTLAEDSGLEVDALRGRPGVRSARFAGPRATDEANNLKLLRLLGAKPPSKRRARFVCTMVLARDGRVIKEIRAEARGVVAVGPRGRGGFGYDPLFYAPRLGKTFAELAPAVKNKVSHRGRALAKLKRFLRRELARNKT